METGQKINDSTPISKHGESYLDQKISGECGDSPEVGKTDSHLEPSECELLSPPQLEAGDYTRAIAQPSKNMTAGDIPIEKELEDLLSSQNQDGAEEVEERPVRQGLPSVVLSLVDNGDRLTHYNFNLNDADVNEDLNFEALQRFSMDENGNTNAHDSGSAEANKPQDSSAELQQGDTEYSGQDTDYSNYDGSNPSQDASMDTALNPSASPFVPLKTKISTKNTVSDLESQQQGAYIPGYRLGWSSASTQGRRIPPGRRYVRRPAQQSTSSSSSNAGMTNLGAAASSTAPHTSATLTAGGGAVGTQHQQLGGNIPAHQQYNNSATGAMNADSAFTAEHGPTSFAFNHHPEVQPSAPSMQANSFQADPQSPSMRTHPTIQIPPRHLQAMQAQQQARQQELEASMMERQQQQAKFRSNAQNITVTLNNFKKMVEKEVHARLGDVCDYYEAREDELWEEREYLMQELIMKQEQCKRLSMRMTAMERERGNLLMRLKCADQIGGKIGCPVPVPPPPPSQMAMTRNISGRVGPGPSMSQRPEELQNGLRMVPTLPPDVASFAKLREFHKMEREQSPAGRRPSASSYNYYQNRSSAVGPRLAGRTP